MGPGAPVIWHTAPMADTGKPDDANDDGPSLEMPSFSLRRKKKGPEEAAAPDPTAEPDPDTAILEPAEPAEPTQPVEPATAVVPVVEPEADEAPAEPAGPKRRGRRQLPTIALSGITAAAVTGVVIGGLAVLLDWLATSACDVVRGTSSCGGGPGLLILVVVLVALAYVGGVLLRVLGAPDAASTSILAVGIMAVLVLVFLLDSIDEWWMAIAIPVAAVIAYCASWWVTDAVVGLDTEAEAAEPHDVR